MEVSQKGNITMEVIKLCSKCKQNKPIASQRYCRLCKNSYMRGWRKSHPLTEKQRFKSDCRRKLNMRIQRGQMSRQPCEICGDIHVQAHHEDYTKPYHVKWLCIRHHLDHHKGI